MSEEKSLSLVSERFSLVPRNLTEAMEYSKLIASSEVCPKDFAGKPGNVLVAVQMGIELGLQPLQAIQNIAVINGRPTMWGDAVLGLVKASGLLESIEEKVDAVAMVAYCTVKRKGEPNAVTRSFGMADAKAANLAAKPGPWQQYPKRMLQMRARSWALRDVFPDVLKGLHIREEVEDYETVGKTPEGVEIMQPKAKGEIRSGAVDDFTKGSKVAAQEAKKIDRSKLVRVMVESTREASGNGKPFFVVAIEKLDGTKAELTTFSPTDFATATELKGRFALVIVSSSQKKDPKTGEVIKTYHNLEHVEPFVDEAEVPPQEATA